MKLWLERDGKVVFGQGRQQLLEAVERTGSLAGAARELNMSYRAAWGRIKASEERLGFALVEPGEEGRRGLRLTAKAQAWLQHFRAFLAEAEALCRRTEEAWPPELKH